MLYAQGNVKRNWWRIDWEGLNAYLEVELPAGIPTANVGRLGEEDLERQNAKFIFTVQTGMEMFVPVKYKNTKTKPWWPSNLTRLWQVVKRICRKMGTDVTVNCLCL